MASSDGEHGVPSLSFLEAEEPFVESYRWMVDVLAYSAPLPSVPLRFLDQLAGYAVRLVLRVDQMVQSIVGSRLLALNRLR